MQEETPKDPLSFVVEFLEKRNKDGLASQVIDVFADYADLVYQQEPRAALEMFNQISKLYLDVREIDKAEKYSLKCLDIATDIQQIYNIRSNLVKMYNSINEPIKALSYNTKNKAIAPKDPDVLLSELFSLYLLNRKDEGETILRELKAREHELDEKSRITVDFNLGSYDMAHGNFKEGLAGFLLNVKKLKIWFSPRELPGKFWEGGVFPGKTIIIFMEGGGIGDEFIVVRFMDNLKDLGMKPIFYTSRTDVAKIFNRCGYEAVTSIEHLPKDTMWTYAMQTPIWLDLDADEVKRTDQYLYPSTDATIKWSKILSSKKKKIGVRWGGQKKNERELHRRVDLDTLMTMLLEHYKGQDVEFYSLQVEDNEDAKRYPQLIDVTDQIKSYDDTFAMLQRLDLVVTSCTSVLHAAAISGIQTLGLIPISAYFTWISPSPNNTSIWYGDNLRLFQQQTCNKWDEPIEEMRNFMIEHKL